MPDTPPAAMPDQPIQPQPPAPSPQWHFFEQPPEVTERNPVSGEFFSNDTRLESVVREAIQNSLDARVDKTDSEGHPVPARVRIYFSGEDGAVPPEKYAPYRLGADAQYRDPGSKLIDPPDPLEPCVFLAIEDFETTGLTGNSDEKPLHDPTPDTLPDWNYFNYFFRDNISDKAGTDKIGSWGTGKCVFQRASRLKSSFAYTIRDNYEPRRLLAGKATLQTHRDQNNPQITWTPDGWFGIREPRDPDRPNRNPRQPVKGNDNEHFIDDFVTTFNLTRIDEPGTSIVIPYVMLADEDGNYDRQNLVQSVLRNFLVAIHDGLLEVEIQVGKDNPVKIDKLSLPDLSMYLPQTFSRDDRENSITQDHYSLFASICSPDFDEAQKFHLSGPKAGNPEWDDKFISENDLPKIRELLHDGKPVLLTLPLPIRKKGFPGILNGVFQMALIRSPSMTYVPPAFYRAGLLIDKVKSIRRNGYVAIVLIGKGPVADMLVTAEPPSHSEWKYDADRIREAYPYPQKHVYYVAHSVRNVLDAIARSDNKPDYDVLKDFLGIPHKSKRRGPGDNGPGGNPPQRQDPPPRKDPYLLFPDSGPPNGFIIKRGPGLVSAAPSIFPFRATMEIGYDTFTGLAWSPFDFDLKDGSPVKISVVNGGEAVSIESADKNNITLLINEQAKNVDFRIEVTGFDVNRDPMVDKVRYKYEKKPKDEAISPSSDGGPEPDFRESEDDETTDSEEED